MSYKEKPQIKLFKFENSAFVLQAIIDDYQECSFEHNIYQAGQFSIVINFNIPNSQLFQRGLFVQFGNNPYDFGEILTIQDAIGEDGKGSQLRTIMGFDARYILKRRVIKNMNSNGLWVMTAKGELCLRNLIKDQCGSGAESKRQLPITNVIPDPAEAIGKVYSVSEQFANVYEVCQTIATQSEIGWRLAFNGSLSLECFSGTDRTQTVQFSTSFESLANGSFSDSSESFSNAIYIGGKGQNDDRDIYEGEDGSPEGLDRFESWDNQSSMTTENEYEAEALSMLSQYGQTLTMEGNGLAKSPYIFREQYDIGDIIKVAFSGKSANAQILSVTEHWAWGNYDIQFSFGKPQPNLDQQLQLMLRKIQSASNKTNSTDSVRWYTIPTDTAMPKADVTYNTIGFIGTCAEGGSTFKLYLDNEKTGAKTYHIYFKQLGGGNLTLTTGKAGATDLVMNSGTYVAIIYVDENGNVTSQGATPTNTIQAGNYQPLTSDGATSLQPVDTVTSGNMHSVTSNAVNNIIGRINNNGKININLQGTVWLKIGTLPKLSVGEVFELECENIYYIAGSTSKKITIMQGTNNNNSPNFYVEEKSASSLTLLKILRIGYNNNWDDGVGVYLKYEANATYANAFAFMFKFLGGLEFIPAFTTSAQEPTEYQHNIDFDLHSSGLYANGVSVTTSNQFINVESGNVSATIGANTGSGVEFTFTIPNGYKVIGFNGYTTSSPGGAINLYSIGFNSMYGKTGEFKQNIFFRNYTSSQQTATINVFVLCVRI